MLRLGPTDFPDIGLVVVLTEKGLLAAVATLGYVMR